MENVAVLDEAVEAVGAVGERSDPEFAAAMRWLALNGGARSKLDGFPGARVGNLVVERVRRDAWNMALRASLGASVAGWAIHKTGLAEGLVAVLKTANDKIAYGALIVAGSWLAVRGHGLAVGGARAYASALEAGSGHLGAFSALARRCGHEIASRGRPNLAAISNPFLYVAAIPTRMVSPALGATLFGKAALAEARAEERREWKAGEMAEAFALEGPKVRSMVAYRSMLVLAGALAEGHVGFGPHDENLALGKKLPPAPESGSHPSFLVVHRAIVERRMRDDKVDPARPLAAMESWLAGDVERAQSSRADPHFAPAPGLPTLAQLAMRVEGAIERGDEASRLASSPERRVLRGELAQMLAPWRAAVESKAIAEALAASGSASQPPAKGPRRRL